MYLTFEAHGEQLVARKLERFGERATHAEPAFLTMSKWLMKVERKQFETDGHFGSGGWAELKEATIEAKRRSPDPTIRGNAENILRATNALMKSLTEPSDENMLLLTGPAFLAFGSKLNYAGPHQHGSPSTNLPRRPPLDLRETHRRSMVKMLQSYIVTGKVEEPVL
jgi:phage gpG-like protein